MFFDSHLMNRYITESYEDKKLAAFIAGLILAVSNTVGSG